MKKRIIGIFLVVISCLLIFPGTLTAASLTSLVINENIVPGKDSVYLTVNGLYSDGTSRAETDVSWTVSDREIASVSSGGRLSFTGKGGVVTIRAYKNGYYAIKSVTVKPWPEKIKIETRLVPSENAYRLMLLGTMSDGEDRYLTADDGVIWSTSNPFVAWVNTQGIVTFTGEEGSVRIKAVLGKLEDSVNTRVSNDEDDSDAYPWAIRITNDIKYSAEPVELVLVALLSDDTERELDNGGADWSSSNPEVVTVNAGGVLRFTGKAGISTIKAIYGGYSTEKVVTVGRFIVNIAINESLNYTNTWDGKTIQLSATVKYNDGSEYIQSAGLTWSVDNKKVAAITTDGALTFTGTAGEATITAAGQTESNPTPVQDAIAVLVPQSERAVPQKLFIMDNPLSAQAAIALKAQCLYSDGSLRDVTESVLWKSLTPDTASIFQNMLYLAPEAGAIKVTASYQGLTDQISAYNYGALGKPERVYQLKIKQHRVTYHPQPIKLTALVQMGNGSYKDVTSLVSWQSTQPGVARVKSGSLTWTGRIGKTLITVQGYGFRDELELEVLPVELSPRVERLALEGILDKGAVQLKAIAYYNNGKTQDVTTQAVWNTSHRHRATVSPTGMVMFPTGFQPVEITAAFGGQTARLSRVQ